MCGFQSTCYRVLLGFQRKFRSLKSGYLVLFFVVGGGLGGGWGVGWEATKERGGVGGGAGG